MYKEDIAKIFAMDVREKKRTGANIFRRVSTRKGSSNMSSMRVPTAKQLKELSGDVTTFNMKEILPIAELEQKSAEDQKMLVEFWRKHYTNTDIMDKLGIEKNRFYRLLKELNIQRKETTRGPVSSRTTMTDSELNSYLEDKENYLDYELFRIITSEQQDILLKEYLTRTGSVPRLAEVWKDSVPSSLYYIAQRIKKKQPKHTEDTLDETIENTSGETVAETKPEDLEDHMTDNTQTDVLSASEVTDMTEHIVENAEETDEPAVTEEADATTPPLTNTSEVAKPSVENPYLAGHHHVRVDMDTQKEGNDFSFRLKGTYSKSSIIRRLHLLMGEIEESEETLTIDLSIKG